LCKANKANVSAPQEILLPLLAEYKTYEALGNSYSKNDNNFVVIKFNFVRIDGGVFPTGVIGYAVLPKGFRPTSNIYFSTPYSTTLMTSEQLRPTFDGTVGCCIRTDGYLTTNLSTSNIKTLFGSVGFYGQ